MVSRKTSLVVPAMSVTIALERCVNAFSSEDLPAFGFPAMATFKPSRKIAPCVAEGVVLARTRHIIALEESLESINNALIQLDDGAIELMAEDLRHAGQSMASITGEFL